MLGKKIVLVFLMMMAGLHARSETEDLKNLSLIGPVIRPGNSGQRPDLGWVRDVQMMMRTEVYDSTALKIRDRMCAKSGNRSVLLVGPSVRAARFVLARFAGKFGRCAGSAHVVLDTSKLEAGTKYRGTFKEKWQRNLAILRYQGAVLYVEDLASLIGLGNHAFDSTGLEASFSQDMRRGSLPTVAYVSSNMYGRLEKGEYDYVLQSFADVIRIPHLDEAQITELLKSIAANHSPPARIEEETLKYLKQLSAHHLPNHSAFDRSVTILESAIKKAGVIQPHVSFEHVRQAVMDAAGVPHWVMERDYTVIKNLREKLDEAIVGVEGPKEDLIRLVKNGYVTGRTDDKPLASVLFTGPTGTGKTYSARQLAEILGLRLVIFDMTSYKHPYQVTQFSQSVGKNLVDNPYSILLFEEIDKAAPEVLDKLYFLMDEGVFFDDSEHMLSGRGAFIIMTTNAGSAAILENSDPLQRREALTQDLQRHFRLSFINRFDAISLFLPFSEEEFHQLANVLIRKKLKVLERRNGWKLKLDPEIIAFVGREGGSRLYGARPMERLIDEIIGVGFAEFQLQNYPIPWGAEVSLYRTNNANEFEVRVNGDSIRFKFVHRTSVND